MDSKSVFISYSHEQADWIRETLVPCLDTGGAKVLIDYREFSAGRTVIGQMDAVQDQADINILIITKAYMNSEYCKHEMNRAIQRDPDFKKGIILPIKREACTLPVSLSRPDQPLYINLTNDRDSNQWGLLMKSCRVDIGVPFPEWINARDQICTYLERNQSVNFVVNGKGIKWHGLLKHIQKDHFPYLGTVDLQSGLTVPRYGLIEQILNAAGMPTTIPKEGDEDLVMLANAFKRHHSRARVAIIHFDMVQHRPDYDWNLYGALRDLLMVTRRLVLLIQSQKPFAHLLPAGNPLSSVGASSIKLVELRKI